MRYAITDQAVMEVATPAGLGRLYIDPAFDARAVLLLGHGARAGVDAPDLEALASGLPPVGIAVVRFEQPWRVLGRDAAGPAQTLDTAWKAALAEMPVLFPGLPMVAGGRSAGARVACRCYAQPQRGLVLLGFPLHPVGYPWRISVHELARVAGDSLLVQGTEDPMGTPKEIESALETEGQKLAKLEAMEGQGHGLAARTEQDMARLPAASRALVRTVRRFIDVRLETPPRFARRNEMALFQ